MPKRMNHRHFEIQTAKGNKAMVNGDPSMGEKTREAMSSLIDAAHEMATAREAAKSCEQKVIDKINHRRLKGLQKYGVTVDDNKLSRLEWLQHAQDEAMDFAIYLQKLINLEITL